MGSMNVATHIKEVLAKTLAAQGAEISASDIHLEFPADLTHGDYASNIALAYAKQLGISPKELADKIVTTLGAIEAVSKIEIAGPGFINFTLDSSALVATTEAARAQKWGSANSLTSKEIMVEYTQPNPFKPFHIGHLMSNAIGESISRLVENAGAKVVRANYQGDVGPHVAKCLWGIQKLGVDIHSADDMGRAYAYGSNAYDTDNEAKTEIDALNKKIYEASDESLNKLYKEGREASLAHFEEIYQILGTRFDHYFFESETAQKGVKIIEAHPDIFVESDGARVFKGEDYGLHTRVFITSQGLPTYETKEIGLETLKQELYPDVSDFIITTAVEQKEYFAVVKQALALIDAKLSEKLTHVSHGMMRFADGKMSSRKGNVITGESIIDSLIDIARALSKDSRANDPEQLAREVAVAAIKYQILKGASGKDIVFDEKQALSTEGDSGPYLQYAHARCCAIIEKSKLAGVEANLVSAQDFGYATMLARLLVRFPLIVERATTELQPHHIAHYLIEVASAFNAWYAQEQILDGSGAQSQKVAVVEAVARTLQNGLGLLGIPAPEKM